MKRLYHPKHLALLAILSCLTISACSVTSPSSSNSSSTSSSQVTPSSDTSSQEPPASTSQEPITSFSQEGPSSSQETTSSSEITSSSEGTSSSSEISSSSEASSSSSEESSSSEISSSSIEPSSSSSSSSSSESSTSEESSSESSSSSSSQKKTYTVTWKNGDSVLETDLTVEEGNMPSYDGATPNKAKDAQYTYVFDGWTPALAPVNSDVTYTAKFSSSTNAYEITWKDYDDSVIEKTNVEYGSVPSHTGPKRADDASYTYTFKAWDPTPVAVTGEATYKATYTATAKPVVTTFPDTIYFTNNKGWNTVKAHCWGGTGTATTWPGKPMTFFKVNESSQDVYSISGMSKYENVIFTDGSNQTVDISSKDLGKDKNAYYCLDTKDSKGHYKVGQWYESGEASYSFKTKGQNILHCFDWKISTIMNNLDAIASQGFNAIQISPIQPVKDYSDSYDDTHKTWWRFYQPIGLCIANQTTNILFSTDDGAAELTALCEAAAAKGIRIIADVIVNHLADDSVDESTKAQHLSPQVKDFCPDIYNNISQTLHNPTAAYYADYNSAYGIVRSDAFGKDLNTANSIVQGYVLNFLKSLIDCGVTGFRFDAAKHIETSYDDNSIKSNFWANTLGAACTYASKTYSRTIWTYGEMLAANEHGRAYSWYINSWFYAVTPPSDYWNVGVDACNCVFWGESHDMYMENPNDSGQDSVNATYAGLANNKDVNLLYFVRPDPNGKIIDGGVGKHAEWGWQNGDVKTANSAHN